jgi:hypothetical protein
MSFTTCHTITNEFNLGCNYNISLASQFFGISEIYIGRLILFKTLVKLKAILLDLSHGNDRFESELYYTKLILGYDYILDHTGKVMNRNLIFNYLDKDYGFKGCHDCLPQKVIYFFLDLYSETRYKFLKEEFQRKGLNDFAEYYNFMNDDKNYPAHDAVIIPDKPTTYDPIYNFPIKGTELRIYNAHRFVNVEAVLYNKKIYQIEEWKIEVENIFNKYINIGNTLINDYVEYIIRTKGNNIPTELEMYANKVTNTINLDKNIIQKRLKNYKIANLSFPNNLNVCKIYEHIRKNSEAFFNKIIPLELDRNYFIFLCDRLKKYCEDERHKIEMGGGKNNNYYNKYMKYKYKYINQKK